MKHQFQPQPIPRLLRQLAGSVLLLTLLFSSCKKKEDGLHMDGDKLELVSGKKTQSLKLSEQPGVMIGWNDGQWTMEVFTEFNKFDSACPPSYTFPEGSKINFRKGILEVLDKSGIKDAEIDLNYLDGVILYKKSVDSKTALIYPCAQGKNLITQLQDESSKAKTGNLYCEDGGGGMLMLKEGDVVVAGTAGTIIIEDNSIEFLKAIRRKGMRFGIREGTDWFRHRPYLRNQFTQSTPMLNTLSDTTWKYNPVNLPYTLCEYDLNTYDFTVCNKILYITDIKTGSSCKLSIGDEGYTICLSETTLSIGSADVTWKTECGTCNSN